MDVDRMPAGRELDFLIAEKVLGKSICQHSKTGSVAQSGGFAMCGDRECSGKLHADYVPKYSESIEAVWEVVEKLKSQGVCMNLNNTGTDKDKWCVQHDGGDPGGKWLRGEWAETAPLAICRAALKCVGVK